MPWAHPHRPNQGLSNEWWTPPHVFEKLGIGFDLDPCSPPLPEADWIPARRRISLPVDGLSMRWEGSSTPGSVRATRSGENSSPDGGLPRSSSTTSETSELTLFPESMCSPEASRAVEPRRRASATGSTTIRPFSGTRWPEPCANFDPATASSRTSPTFWAWRQPQASLLEASGEPFSRTWPRSASISNGIAFQREPSAPRTSVTGCSVLLPTPKRITGGQTISHATREGRTYRRADGQKVTVTTEQAVIALLPTPTVGDSRNSRNGTAERRAEKPGHPGMTLSDVAYEWSGATTSPPSDDGSKSTGQRPRLSPEFVEWMQGTPTCSVCGRGWTDSGCPHSATEFTAMSPGSPENESSNLRSSG